MLLTGLIIFGCLIGISFLLLSIGKADIMFLPFMFSITIFSIFLAKEVQQYSGALSIMISLAGILVPTYFIVRKIKRNKKM